jgi:hypothetical protein
MAGGSDGGPSKSADRVGKIFGESGKTVDRRLKVLEAIETAEADGDRKRAEQLTKLLEDKHIVKALDLIDNKPAAPRKPPPVTVPRTLLDFAQKAYSEFFEACTKVECQGELEQVESYYRQMGDKLQATRAKLRQSEGQDAAAADEEDSD